MCCSLLDHPPSFVSIIIPADQETVSVGSDGLFGYE